MSQRHPHVQDLETVYYKQRPDWVDGTSMFVNLIAERLPENAAVLDVGAGAGQYYYPFLRSRIGHFVGIDVDETITRNSWLDESYRCDGAKTPLLESTIDLAFSDFVFEHLSDPAAVVKEIFRVLKPGGHVVIRTPNKWHYVVAAARLLSLAQQRAVLTRLTGRLEEDVFPKFYRCNTEPRLRRLFTGAGFEVEFLALVEREPTYLEKHPALYFLGIMYERTVNGWNALRFLRSSLFGVFRKPLHSDDPKLCKSDG